MKRVATFHFSADVPELANRLAEKHWTTASGHLQRLIASAVRVIVRCQPVTTEGPFIVRLRELAEGPHPRPGVTTSYNLVEKHIEGIRELQNSLKLPRQGLVVEYLFRASDSVYDGDNGEEGGDEIERCFRSTSQNLQNLVTSPSDGPEARKVHPSPQLRLLKGDLPTR